MYDHMDSTDPRSNGAKIRRILERQSGSATLYRQTVAGPSGQRNHTPICDIWWVGEPLYCLAIRGARSPYRDPDGYAGITDDGEWSIWVADHATERARLMGWANSLVVGADVLIHGEYVALRNHDSARVSHGTWRRNPDYRPFVTLP